LSKKYLNGLQINGSHYLSRLTFRRQVVTFSTKHTVYSYDSCIICLNI